MYLASTVDTMSKAATGCNPQRPLTTSGPFEEAHVMADATLFDAVDSVKPLILMPVPGTGGVHAAGSDGWIYRVDGDAPVRLPSAVYKTGYAYVSIKMYGKRANTVHRIVCIAFHGMPPFKKAQVNHKDLNKTNNTPENLEWVTCQQNIIHAVKAGAIKSASGEDCVNSKLNWEKVREIRSLVGVVPIRQLARQFGVHRRTIQSIVRRINWKTEVLQ